MNGHEWGSTPARRDFHPVLRAGEGAKMKNEPTAEGDGEGGEVKMKNEPTGGWWFFVRSRWVEGFGHCPVGVS